jgi:hypothetical protein
MMGVTSATAVRAGGGGGGAGGGGGGGGLPLLRVGVNGVGATARGVAVASTAARSGGRREARFPGQG